MGQGYSRDPTSKQFQSAIVAWCTLSDQDDRNELEDGIESASTHAETHPWEVARVLPYNCTIRHAEDDAADDYLLPLLSGDAVQDSARNHDIFQGKPRYSCYVDRFLPGKVKRHRWDGHPTNAIVWDKDREEGQPMQELARAHVTDNPSQNSPFTLYDHLDPKCVQPITTKAGSRLWSISFATNISRTNQHLKASYPGQLLIRIDKGRQSLIYDSFEYEPMSLEQKRSFNLEEGKFPECTLDELKAVEFLLKMGRKKECPFISKEDMLKPIDGTSRERIQHIGLVMFLPLLERVRFKRSRLFRLRFPLESIVGARYLEYNTDRPQATTAPLPKSDLSTEDLGEYGQHDEDETGGRAQPGTLEACDEKIENLGVLILELDHPCQDFSATVCCPVNQRDRKRFSVEDWTPHRTASHSNRHYIVGDASEIRELVEFLIEFQPRLQALLAPNLVDLTTVTSPRSQKKTDSTKKEQDEDSSPKKRKHAPQQDIDSLKEALEFANTLGGPVSSMVSSTSPHVPSLTSKASFQILYDSGILPRPQYQAATKPTTSRFSTTDQVDTFLEQCGIEFPDGVNSCLKAGLLNSNIDIPEAFLEKGSTEFLEHVICQRRCCKSSIDITVQSVLKCGNGKGPYWDCEGHVECPNCHSSLIVSNLCGGKIGLDSGKFHNHCESCPEFGECIGDYRNAHCFRCGDHYFQGNSGFPCSCRGQSNFGGYHNDDDNNSDDDDYDDGVGEYFRNRNSDGILQCLFDPPARNAWKGLYLSEPYEPVQE